MITSNLSEISSNSSGSSLEIQGLDLAAPTDHKVQEHIAEALSYLDPAFTQSEHQPIRLPINYLGEAFTPMTEVATANIPSLVEHHILQPSEAKIYCHPRVSIDQFNFRQNGFEFCRISPELSGPLHNLAQDPENRENRVAVREEIIPYLTQWGKEQEIDFDYVVPVDTVYRNTNQDVKNAFGSVPLAHVDFPQKDYPATLGYFEPAWKSNVEKVLDTTLTSSEYTHLNVPQAINIWIPLNEHNTENTLAVMDTSTLSEKDELAPYSAVRRGNANFVSQGVYPKPKHKWVVESDMKFGDAVIFDSRHTPHTAIDIPKADDCDPYRQSIEIRALFIKK